MTPTDLDAARQRVADLEREQADLPDRKAAARHKRDADEWFAVMDREEALPGELAQARRDVVAPELEAAWQEAEARHADEQQARQAFARAFADRDAAPSPTLAESRSDFGARQQRNAELDEAYEQARYAHEQARHQLQVALAAVDEAEQRYRSELGEDPPAGEGLRAPIPPLASTVQIAHPDSWAPRPPDQPRVAVAPPAQTFVAGTRPPRWAAVVIDNPKAWHRDDEPKRAISAGVRMTTDREATATIRGPGAS